jgi:hypothetical protein
MNVLTDLDTATFAEIAGDFRATDCAHTNSE